MYFKGISVNERPKRFCSVLIQMRRSVNETVDSLPRSLERCCSGYIALCDSFLASEVPQRIVSPYRMAPV